MTDDLPTSAPPVTPDAWCHQVESLLGTGAPLPAYDAASDGLAAFPGHVRLRQLLALALARSGASRQANALLETLREDGNADEETLGMLARTHKDLAMASPDASGRRHQLELARRAYRDAYATSRGYWSGINVATTSLLLDASDDAAAVARQVRDTCLQLWQEDPNRSDRYWILATLGEASLVLGERGAAEDWYARAAATSRARLADLASTRRNARLLLHHLGADTATVDACFAIPRVVVFAGHLIDRPGRSAPRFPTSLEPAVRDAIRSRIASAGAGIGVSSAACGGDLIFLECLAERRATSHVVLPYNPQQFLADSVAIVPGADWPARFDRALDTATEVVVASVQRMGDGGTSYDYAFRLLDGIAGVRADELDTELVCLAVWDGRTGDGTGGTATAVEHWRATGRAVDIIDTEAILRDHTIDVRDVRSEPSRAAPGDEPPAPATGFDPRIVGLLFADVAGFSKMTDAEVPLFVAHVLGLVANGLTRLPTPPLLTNTWGDGIYVVFATMRDTGAFALWLRDAMRSTDWQAKGFAGPIDIRIGLHAGPAYACQDPVSGRPNFIGEHVSRAARIEPITPPGEVYASRAFAALARADAVREFACRYVGPTPLAKGYGTFPMYVVQETHPA